jgi:predicted RNA-binding protein YlqC (UPF0109 family)
VQDLVTFIVRGLVGDDVEVAVDEETTASERILHIRVPEAERGLLIGRQGRTIRAIETVLAAAPSSDGRRAAVKVAGRS